MISEKHTTWKSESENDKNNKEEPDTGLSGPDEQSSSLHYKRMWKWKSERESESEKGNNKKEDPDTGLSGPEKQSTGRLLYPSLH